MREGVHVNDKRAERLYRLEELVVPRVPRPPITAPNDKWALDFVHDPLSDDRTFRCLTVADPCTHECVGLTVAHSLPSEAVTAALDLLIGQRSAPQRMSFDNGPPLGTRAL